MSNLKNKILFSSVVMTGLLAVGAIGILPAYAEGSDYPPVVQKLAERFNLNPAEVEDVFMEERAEREASMLQNFESKLSAAVENGKISEEQKQAILDKHEELRAKMDELKSQGLTREEMREQMRVFHEELKTWASEEGLDFPFMLFKFGGQGQHRAGMMFTGKN